MSTYAPNEIKHIVGNLLAYLSDWKDCPASAERCATMLETAIAEQRAEIARQTARADINERYAQSLEFALIALRDVTPPSMQDLVIKVNAERVRTIKALEALGE